MTSVEAVPACLFAAPSVVQPPHLEGDPTLATEILPGPPSLVSIQQLGLPKKDHKKTAVIASYLPPSDPGTTYGVNSVSTMATMTEVDGPRRKRARLDKGSASSRAQRASARNMAAASTASDSAAPPEAVASSSHVVPDSDPFPMQIESDDAGFSRSNSLTLHDEHESISSMRNGARKDKGKGKEKVGGVRIKEEPGVASIVGSDVVIANASSNEDHCSACRSLGSLVYCDGCPRAYHLWCLNPPMDAEDLPAGDARWFCPSCSLRQKPPIKVSAGLKFMAPLVEQADATLPTEYSLPQDIRAFFKDVATGPKGNYVDSSELKPPRLNRHGQLEEREPYRLKDRNGEPVLCFRCGTSALPPDFAAAAPATKRARRATSSASNTETGRGMISCDYCHLHWHLDCVEPPLAYMPPWNKKWMCPNHVEQVLPTKRRIPKTNAAPIDVTKPHEFNNGNIEVIHPETAALPPPKLAIDEVLINGRRYRVPERVITMDFWNKTGRRRSHRYQDYDASSAMSSPLTSLSSLPEDDLESSFSLGPPPRTFDLDELRAAMTLCGMHSKPAQSQPAANGTSLSPPITKLESKPAAEKRTNDVTNDKSKVAEEAVPMVVDEPAGAHVQTEPAPRRSGRSSTGRRLRPWNKTSAIGVSQGYTDELDDLSEDYLPPSARHRQTKRDAAGKIIKKPEGKTVKAPTQPSAETSEEPNALEDVVHPLASTSSRPKRARHPSRRFESPALVPSVPATTSAVPSQLRSSSAKTALPVAPVSPREAAAAAPPIATSDKRAVNGTSTSTRSTRAASSTASTPAPTNGAYNVQPLALNVPAPTTLHPSLRYKPIAPAPLDPPKTEIAIPPRAAPITRRKPATPVPNIEKTASTSDAVTPAHASTTRVESTTPSTGLKIRLPRMGGPTLAAASNNGDQDGSSTSHHKSQNSSNSSRPRRSLRRQSSRSTSVTGTSLSTPPSPKLGGMIS